ncbi:MAG: hypothetical protein HYX24_01920 [Candidatus Aenigmarchaeota archaeon]|nr:hypothetical protein [Candidatus Aenigmarchaeota archaeon]
MVQLDTGEQYDGNYYVDKQRPELLVLYPNVTSYNPTEMDMHTLEMPVVYNKEPKQMRYKVQFGRCQRR